MWSITKFEASVGLGLVALCVWSIMPKKGYKNDEESKDQFEDCAASRDCTIRSETVSLSD